MIPVLISRIIVLAAGTLYPAYRSFKAVRTKDVREYVKWMMYWITFAAFLSVETVADIFLAFWLPFYYELKVLFVIWLLSPYTKGASMIYRKFIHPTLVRHENDIDNHLDRARSKSMATMVQLGSQGIGYARQFVATAALRGQEQFLSQLRRSYSLDDVSEGTRVHTESLQRLAVEDSKSRRRARISENIVEVEEDIEEDIVDGEVATKKEVRRVWEGYYDTEGNQLVERELQYLNEEEPGDSDDHEVENEAPVRRSNRRRAKVDPEESTQHYATLPKSTARRSRRPKIDSVEVE